MTDGGHTRWVWEKTDPTHSGASGDISKLFRNELVKNPGAFAEDAPPNAATLLAREVIQNSADAAQELQSELGDEAPSLEIDFDFESITGAHKDRLVQALDLAPLAARVSRGNGVLRSKVGLAEHDCLDSLDDASVPLNMLQVVERGTTGMYGPFTGAKSKMYLALVSLGYTAKLEGAGGSYGYGKAGLIRGSAIRTVVAYTCFRPEPGEPGVTRRLLGMTYWGPHEVDGHSYTGFARFGDESTDGKVRPFENDDADRVAAALGIECRDPGEVDQLGTTFLLLDPVVEPHDLVRAIERNWWPAIEDGTLTATITEDDGELVPRPRRDELLLPFIESYDLALSTPDNQVHEKWRAEFNTIPLPDESRVKPGGLGLIADPGGWSYAIDDSEAGPGVAHKSLVALVRGPRMVVEYLEVGVARPYVRGTFVAHGDVDDLLRQTEPKAHDAWQVQLDESGVDGRGPVVAKAIIDRIKRNVGDFRRNLRPPPRPAEDIRLPELEKLFRNLANVSGSATDSPPEGERPFSINVRQRLEEASDGGLGIQLKGAVRFALRDEPDLPDEADTELTISYRFVEDGGAGEEVPLWISVPAGFELVSNRPYTCRGRLGHEYVEIPFVSRAYPADWTGRLKADALIAAPPSDGSPDDHVAVGSSEKST